MYFSSRFFFFVFHLELDSSSSYMWYLAAAFASLLDGAPLVLAFLCDLVRVPPPFLVQGWLHLDLHRSGTNVSVSSPSFETQRSIALPLHCDAREERGPWQFSQKKLVLLSVAPDFGPWLQDVDIGQ